MSIRFWGLTLLLTVSSSLHAMTSDGNASKKRSLREFCATTLRLSTPSSAPISAPSAYKALLQTLKDLGPDEFANLPTSNVLQFGHGRHVSPGFISADIRDNRSNLIQNRFEILIAGYPGASPAMDIVQSDHMDFNPKRALRYTWEHYEHLRAILPLRNFHSLADDRSFAIVDKIPDYRGTPMTLHRLFTDNSLWMIERLMIRQSLETTLLTTEVEIPNLDIGNLLVFDVRDDTWKLLLVTPDIKETAGSNLIKAVRLHLDSQEPSHQDLYGKFDPWLKSVEDRQRSKTKVPGTRQ